MTAVPHSPLVERVATAIATRRAQSQLPRRLFHIEYAAPTAEDARDAQAALDACHAKELADALRLILPLAKNYAAANPDVAHAKRIETAYDILAELEGLS